MSTSPDARKTAVTSGPRPKSKTPLGDDDKGFPWLKLLVLSVAILLGVGGAFFAWYQLRPDPEVEHVKELRQRMTELFQRLREGGENMDPEERDKLRKEIGEIRKELREAEDDLSAPQQAELNKERTEKERGYIRRLTQAATPEERDAEYRKIEEERRAEWRNRFGGGGFPGGPGFGGRGGRGGGQPGQPGGGPNGGFPGGQPAGAFFGRGGGDDGPGDAARGSKEIDATSAEDRAGRGAMGALRQQLRQLRGGGGFPGGGFPGGFPGGGGPQPPR
jgi:hypothetical protein